MTTATPTIPSTEQSQDTDFVLTHQVDAPRDLVFRVWTDREHLLQWFGPKGCPLASATSDVRPGGMMHYAMRLPDGGLMWGKWAYREIAAPERLVFAASFSDEAGGVTRAPFSAGWPLEMLSTVTFDAIDAGRTSITLRASAHNATELERETFAAAHNSMRQGWGGTFNQLDEYLAQIF